MFKTVTSASAATFLYPSSKELKVTLTHVSSGAEGALIRVQHTGKHNNDLYDLHVEIQFAKTIRLADVWDQQGQRLALNGMATDVTWHIGHLARYFIAELRLPLSLDEASTGIQVSIYSINPSEVYL